MRHHAILFLGIGFFALLATAAAQPGTIIDLKGLKPEEFANKLLRSEKTDFGKLNRISKWVQNNFTRYNYLFNAEQGFRKAMQQAKKNNKDDYYQLLSFYPYDENSLAKSPFLDSAIQHATEGILLHDLRNDYTEDLYFLLGKAYFYEQKYDTAQNIFKYINYAFAPKDDGYDLPIGSNASPDDTIFTIVNKEKKGIHSNISRRNDALVWLVKTFIYQKKYPEAAALLNYLAIDPFFPKRLKPLYDETKAWYFYQKQENDSAAAYLENSSSEEDNSQTRARKNYLSGQLFQLSGDSLQAISNFEKAAALTKDPELALYANMHRIRLQKEVHKDALEQLSKRSKYARYKDIVYYEKARSELNQSDTAAAKSWLQKGLAYSKKQPPDLTRKNKTLLLMGDIAYDQRQFRKAHQYYDSIRTGNIADSAIQRQLSGRRQALSAFAANSDSISVQDSLQAIVNMPEKQRMAILRQEAKRIRRSIDEREETRGFAASSAVAGQQQQSALNLFTNTTGKNQAWYFNNPSLKTQGYDLFKQRFGNRPNLDNWQRVSALNKSGSANAAGIKNSQTEDLSNNFNGPKIIDSANITAEDLLAQLPLTEEQKKKSDSLIAQAILNNGKILQNKLDNFKAAISIYDSLLLKYPKAPQVPEALYNQYICHLLLGNQTEKNSVLAKLMKDYPENKWTQRLQNENFVQKIAPSSIRDTATQAYSRIYDLFIQGKFDEAQSEKMKADNKYGDFYWTPQLLYIESIYHISKQEDSTAIRKLEALIQRFSTSPIKPQAQELVSVLTRRKEIETYLQKLQIQPEDHAQNDNLAKLENAARQMEKEASQQPEIKRLKYIANKEVANRKAQKVAGIEQNTDTNSSLTIKSPATTDTAKALAVTNPAGTKVPPNAVQSPAKKTDTSAVQAQTARKNNFVNKINSDTGLAENVSKDVQEINGFKFNNNAPQYVAVVLYQVAPVFASEAANAFNRYNLLTFNEKKYPVKEQKTGDYNIVLIGPFNNKKEADQYLSKIEPNTANTILPWLEADKYKFSIISAENLQKLKEEEDVKKYEAAEAVDDKP